MLAASVMVDTNKNNGNYENINNIPIHHNANAAQIYVHMYNIYSLESVVESNKYNPLKKLHFVYVLRFMVSKRHFLPAVNMSD